MAGYSSLQFPGLKNEELMYSFFSIAIAVTLIFWPLLNSIFCLLFLAYWLFFVKKDIFLTQKKYWIFLFCSLYLMVLFGMLHSENIQIALNKLQQKSAYILFPVIIGTSGVITEKLVNRSFIALTMSTVLGALFCLINGFFEYLKTGVKENIYGYKLIDALKDMTPFMMSLCCVVCLLFLCNNIYRMQKNNAINFFLPFLLQIATIIFLFLFLLILGNRNVLILASIVLIFYCFKLLKNFFLRMLMLIALAGTFFIAIKSNPYLSKQWKELTNYSGQNFIPLDKDLSLGKSWGGWQLRIAIWRCSWDVIKNNPVFGVGTGDTQDFLQSAYEKRKFYFASRYNRYNTHNQYIQETVTNGFFGLFIFLACLIAPLFVNMLPQEKQFYNLFLFCFAFVCLTDTPLELNKGIILFSFFNSLIFFKSYNFKYKQFNEQATQ
jgi:O-antigen ligase